jgi:hypothetical protein
MKTLIIWAVEAVAIQPFYSAQGTLRANSLTAVSSEHLNRANGFLREEDLNSLEDMINDKKAVRSSNALRIQVDDVNVWAGWIKWHPRGQMHKVSYSAIDDVELDKPR